MSAAEPRIRVTRGAPDPVEVAALTAVLLALAAGREDAGAEADDPTATAAAPWSRSGAEAGSAGSWSGRGLPAWRAPL